MDQIMKHDLVQILAALENIPQIIYKHVPVYGWCSAYKLNKYNVLFVNRSHVAHMWTNAENFLKQEEVELLFVLFAHLTIQLLL